jgi:hypothetical protein
MHDPPWQNALLGHSLPQPPQFCGSLSSERHTPPQLTVPVRQAHEPETQA